jgi:hypothetical protein
MAEAWGEGKAARRTRLCSCAHRRIERETSDFAGAQRRPPDNDIPNDLRRLTAQGLTHLHILKSDIHFLNHRQLSD